MAALVLAETLGTRDFEVSSSGNEVLIDFSYHDFSKELATGVFMSDQSRFSEVEQALIKALRAALVTGAPRVDFETWNGSSGIRLKLAADSAKDCRW